MAEREGLEVITRQASRHAAVEAAVPWTKLLERVLAATGADRRLDNAIWDHFNPPRIDPDHLQPPAGFGEPPSDFGRWTPEYTASLDAAIALVERVRPTEPAWMAARLAGNGQFTAWVMGCPAPAFGATPALALLAALLSSFAGTAISTATKADEARVMNPNPLREGS